jgi:nitrite reductase/ring-hydroxylating ferredoxin subunit
MANPGSASFVIKRGEERVSLMVIRRDGDVFGYLNSCPHIGAPLDYQTNGFLDEDKRHIRCAYHGALFRLEDGVCVSGPPERDCLKRFPLEIKDGQILAGSW